MVIIGIIYFFSMAIIKLLKAIFYSHPPISQPIVLCCHSMEMVDMLSSPFYYADARGMWSISWAGAMQCKFFSDEMK